ncbi:MAG: cob(I)yrinic acid a,c-diamide adenosyltransferase [Chlorobi bacterium]|nr:cob(I)yrinic acid a,c-diamide adenosyltransferase [Chlorobiota bacterium]
MKIYTKTGDKGKTSLFSGGRVLKSDLRIKAYGSVDELNSFIGMLFACEIGHTFKDVLVKIQHKLYNLGSLLAVKGEVAYKLPKVEEKDVQFLENEIDNLNKMLPPLKDFILPGGNKQVAQCHICRTVCRRAERELVELAQSEGVDALLIMYLNRLSDYLFVLARVISKETGANEVVWKP